MTASALTSAFKHRIAASTFISSSSDLDSCRHRFCKTLDNASTPFADTNCSTLPILAVANHAANSASSSNVGSSFNCEMYCLCSSAIPDAFSCCCVIKKPFSISRFFSFGKLNTACA